MRDGAICKEMCWKRVRISITQNKGIGSLFFFFFFLRNKNKGVRQSYIIVIFAWLVKENK